MFIAKEFINEGMNFSWNNLLLDAPSKHGMPRSSVPQELPHRVKIFDVPNRWTTSEKKEPPVIF